MEDTIKRSDAIKAIEDLPNAYNGWSDAYDKAYIIGTLEDIPSAERNCFTCGIVDGQMIFRPEKVSEEVLKANDRCVSLAEVCKILQEEYEVYPATWERFRNLPAVEPTIEIDADQLAKLLREGWTIHSETKQGEWIPNSPYTGLCSECEGEGNLKNNFCPTCGAMMKGADDDAD